MFLYKLFQTRWPVRIFIFFSAAALLLAWLLPSHFLPWVTAYQELLTGVALVLSLAGLLLAPERCRIPLFAMLCLAIAAVPFLQLAGGLVSYAGDAWLNSIYIAAFASSLIVGYNLQANAHSASAIDYVSGFAWLLIVGALVSVGLAFSQWLGYGDLYWVFPLAEGSRPTANLAQPNNMATLLGMALAAVVYLFEKRQLKRIAAVILTVLILFGITLSQSRSPWLTAIFIVLFWAWQRRSIEFSLTNVHMLLWLAIYVVMIFCLPLLAELLGTASSSPVERAQQMDRLGLYEQFTNAVLQGPWYGYGWGQGFTAQAAVAMAHPHYEPSYYAHNILLDLLVWNGPILGGALIIAVAVWLLILLVRATNLTATFAWLALSFFIIHSMLEYPHAYLFLLVPAGVLLGILQASVPTETKKLPLPRWALSLVVLLAAVLVLVVWRDYRLVEKEHQLIFTEKHDAHVAASEQAVSNVYLLTQMREYIYFVRAPLLAGYTEEQLHDLATITGRFPNFFFLLKSAYILTVNGHADQAYQLLLVLDGLYQKDRLEQSLTYLLEKSDEHPDLLQLLEMFDDELARD